MKIKILLTGLFCLGLSLAMNAQSNATPGVSKRQGKQAKRIKQGVKNGELTKGETATLVGQQKSIHKSKKRAKSDGQVTKKERVVLHKRQNNASKNIARKKHNRRNRN